MQSGTGSGVLRSWRLALLIILLCAAALRLFGLYTISPPGLEHDEVAHWLIDRSILAGEHGIYFTEAYGHEAGFHYFQSLFVLLIGDNSLALRLPSAFAGMLLIAVSFLLIRKLFDVRTALLSAALLAILFWPVFYSRLALRAISLPVLSGLSIYFWWQGWTRTGQKTGAEKESLSTSSCYYLAAILAGASLYTYMASRVVPIFYLGFFLYLFLFQRNRFQNSWKGILRFSVIFVLIALPLVLYLVSNPGAESRISEVNGPLTAILAGDFAPAIENSLKILFMFGIRGDPLWRQNVAFLPVFEPLIAAFFYIGLAISLWRWREPRYFLLIFWLFTSAIPSIATIDAPSSIRMINALPIITVFPVIGLEVIHYLGRLSTVSQRLSTNFWRRVGLLALLLIFGLYIARTAKATFQIWPAEEEVRFVWQDALTEASIYLDNSADMGPVSIGGWSPESMDPPTMELSLIRNDLSLRFFDPQTALIIPSADSGEIIRVIRPSILPLNDATEKQLLEWEGSIEDRGAFTIYELSNADISFPGTAAGSRFGGELDLLSYEWLDDCIPGRECQLLTYWRVIEPPGESRRLFLHMVDLEGHIIVQDDKLEIPAQHWQKDDLLLQLLTIELPPDLGDTQLRLGVYDPGSGRRLMTSDGSDYLLLDGLGGR